MNPEDKVNLSSVNKTKKQFSLPKAVSPLKRKSTGPRRDQFGQFSSGSGGLKSLKKFNWSRALPLILIFALVGGYFVFRSFAGTYTACATKDNNYVYSEDCVSDSNEASVVRLYYATFNRAPDKEGIAYWASRLDGTTKPQLTVKSIAASFLGSSEFKNKYGQLNDLQFVQTIYQQAFNRKIDQSSQNYWLKQLDGKLDSRQGVVSKFVQSTEMKAAFSTKVAGALNIAPQVLSTPLVTFSSGDVTCYGTVTVINNKKTCQAAPKDPSDVVASVVMKPGVATKTGAYIFCFNFTSKVRGVNNTLEVESLKNLPTDSVLNYNVNARGSYTIDQSSSRHSCKIIASTASDMKSFLLTGFAGSTASGNMFSVDMTSLSVGLLKNEDVTLLQNQPGAVADIVPGLNTTLGSVTKKAQHIFYRLKSSPNAKQPYLTHTTGYFQGKKEVYNFECQRLGQTGSATIRPVVTDADTGKPLTDYRFINSIYGIDAEQSKIFKAGQDITLPASSGSGYTLPTFTFEVESSVTRRVKVALTVIEGECSTYSAPFSTWTYQQ